MFRKALFKGNLLNNSNTRKNIVKVVVILFIGAYIFTFDFLEPPHSPTSTTTLSSPIPTPENFPPQTNESTPTPPPPTPAQYSLSWTNVVSSLKQYSPTLTTQQHIPFLASFVNQEWEELHRMLSSLDVPVRTLFIVINGHDLNTALYFQVLERQLKEYMDQNRVILDYNHDDPKSFSESVNTAIKYARVAQAGTTPCYFLINADIVFLPNALKTALHFIAQEPRHYFYDFGHGYSAFILFSEMIDRVGYLDENFYPAYWEDMDYHMRIARTGLHAVTVPNVGVNHSQSTSLRKATPAYHQRLNRVERWLYPFMKWGITDARSQGVKDVFNHHAFYAKPFNLTNVGLDFWVKDVQYRECIRSGKGLGGEGTASAGYGHRCWYHMERVCDELTSRGLTCSDDMLYRISNKTYVAEQYRG